MVCQECCNARKAACKFCPSCGKSTGDGPSTARIGNMAAGVAMFGVNRSAIGPGASAQHLINNPDNSGRKRVNVGTLTGDTLIIGAQTAVVQTDWRSSSLHAHNLQPRRGDEMKNDNSDHNIKSAYQKRATILTNHVRENASNEDIQNGENDERVSVHLEELTAEAAVVGGGTVNFVGGSSTHKSPESKANECAVCLQQRRETVALIPCGHLVCGQCSGKIKRFCPQCRQEIKSHQRIFE